MKIPLIYPKIPDATNCPLKTFYAFDKIDGTCIYWQWTKQDRWHSFGTRRDRFPLTQNGIAEFNQAHPGLEEVAPVFLDQLAKSLDDCLLKLNQPRFSYARWSSYDNAEITVFTEFVGKQSFAGQHQPGDPKKLVLFDVMINGTLIPPDQFVWDFKHFNLPRLVHKGRFTGRFVEDVRNGKYKVNEGVVCKGVVGAGNLIVGSQIYMCKIKTDQYQTKLKEQFKGKWKEYWE